MENRKVYHDSVTPLPPEGGLTPHGLLVNTAAAPDPNETLNLHFSFDTPADALKELEAKVASGQTVPFEDVQGKYAPNSQDVENLISWLKSEGFQNARISADRTSVYVAGTVAQIEKSLNVKMVSVTKEGLTYTAALDAPSLPADIGSSVHAIGGLQPFRKANKHALLKQVCCGHQRVAAVTGAAPSPAIDNAPPYLVSEIVAAYNANGLSLTGVGQTIAILIDTVPLDTDLQAFWQYNNLPVTLDQIVTVNVQNTQLPPPEGEETLDVSWASGVAPGATIRIYAAGSLSYVDLDQALDQIIADVPANPGMRQLSISLGLGETYMGGPTGEVATQHQKYLRLAALGVNVFVSSGDAGSNPDATGHSATGPTQVEYAASDPCVVAVGGTTLVLAGDGTVQSETGWASGGGGTSIFFPTPAWQVGNGVPQGTSFRLVPDVSLTADPNDGAFLILNGAQQQIGGTSWSAPVWAAFCALINQARATAGRPALPFLNPLIYPLLGTPSFRDIQSGSNGAFSAGPGYDEVTGIGVPDIANLVEALLTA